MLVSNPDPADVGEDAVVSAYTRGGVHAASCGSIRPDGAIEAVGRGLWADAVVVTPSLYGMCVRTDEPCEICDVLAEFARARVGAFVRAGGRPLAGNDVLPLLVSGLVSGIDVARCQEIFDYAAYEYRDSVGHG
ncbi:hypothetical protein R6V09_34370 [Streptomyces sp. W16]|uniref:hypothetical protein n=1 Tax=Streptomyces sp. W16 TaxID=3076631 RepID=UPI00295B0F63|nr:hypothetical protein [Streptomyces sp. W16]MDV9175186.1 hypothetical protein [Streptomyces sp. W16]